MHLQSTFELTLILDSDKFTKIFDQAYSELECFADNKFADYTLASRGIIVLYQNSQYKKKIKIIVNPCRMLDTDNPNPDKLISKLDKRIERYFNNKYKLDDFELSGMALTTDIDVHSSEKVFDYLKVLRRIGKVKGFSPSNDDWSGGDTGLCYDGNSNGIKFMLYDLEALHGEQEYFNIGQSEYCEGVLRAEVRLTKPKSIRGYTNKSSIVKQITDLYDNREQIFLDTFLRVVPFGDFYKKDKTEEIIRAKVKDATIRRKMLWLVELIPDKKSLLLAQKALNYRRINKVMKAFFDIGVAPITISKRHDIKKLDNLYNYL
ncbi:MAG: hypothetical protein FWC32_08090 [Firmicutes bacterium]|nr:hypothetical protein [Bacillota bacterium]